MSDIKYQILYWIMVEVFLIIIFYAVSKWLNPKNPITNNTEKFTSWLKGFLERLFLAFLLLSNLQGGALVLFGAIKLGTRLDSDKERKVSNDYFVVGNFLSIAGAVVTYLLFKEVLKFN
ncbi:hypothetical protein L0P88_22375 [Muricauda sp. SCSIO 64092]|uniref:hypothetical protein n=1 Tax=Allomuricauda sp. SCSIO 64092 TaxID=2908842 RepID=UPI001FF2CB31|nr:hypothetical protein [Muricauda sp. SCSIO 64092]UOY06655.1 hypothetical protein L0P88_22375 [Muricauda sp. SCSIO 64092]